ncbi:MAG: hypothetical protein ABIA76_04070 [Candidatus Diapherotrites archaeon]
MNWKLFLFGFALFIFVFGCVQETPSEIPPINNENNSLPPAIDCPEKCKGTTWMSEGESINGECVYSESELNSEKCGYIASDLCEEIECGNKCSEKAWLENGECISGECIYKKEIQNSIKCKYSFDVFVQDCYYLQGPENSFGIFFSIKNLGEEETKDKESIWIKGTDKVYQYQYLNYNYGKNRTLFDTINWTSILIKWRQKPYKGQLFEIEVENGLAPENDVSFQLIYCPEGTNPRDNDCDESNGLVLYESTTQKCLQEIHPDKYNFSNECTADYCIALNEYFDIEIDDEANEGYITNDPDGYDRDIVRFVRKTDDYLECEGQQNCFGKDVFRFQAKAEGTTTISIEKCKAGNCDATAKTEEFTVDAREKQ